MKISSSLRKTISIVGMVLFLALALYSSSKITESVDFKNITVFLSFIGSVFLGYYLVNFILDFINKEK